MEVPKYPPPLSSSALAKIESSSKTTTKLVPQLKALEIRYKAIKWSVFDAKAHMTVKKTSKQLEASVKAADNEYTSKVRSFTNLVAKTALLAKVAEDKLAKAKGPSQLIAY